jgi:hypothetical protein
MNIKQALKRGHLHIVEYGGRIELYGQENGGGVTWPERLEEYEAGNDYEEFKHAE